MQTTDSKDKSDSKDNSDNKVTKLPPQLFLCPPITNETSLVQMATKSPPLGWESVFNDALPELEHLDRTLAADSIHGEFFPRRRDIFKAFQLCPLHKVRVIIIGQDPYPEYHQLGIGPRAQGMSFSVDSQDSTPRSLQNIFKELKSDITNWVPYGPGNLVLWALQGVLLLNADLTFRRKPSADGKKTTDNVHKDWWAGFTTKILRAIAFHRPRSIYVMWGSRAQGFINTTDTQGEKLTAAHPSPFSAHTGFFGCKHFSRINAILIQRGEAPINWWVL